MVIFGWSIRNVGIWHQDGSVWATKWCQAKWAYIDTTRSNRGNLSMNCFFFGKAYTPMSKPGLWVFLRTEHVSKSFGSAKNPAAPHQATAAWWRQVWERRSHHTPGCFIDVNSSIIQCSLKEFASFMICHPWSSPHFITCPNDPSNKYL